MRSIQAKFSKRANDCKGFFLQFLLVLTFDNVNNKSINAKY